MFGFPITKDMKSEALTELLRNNVSGESKVQLQQILREPQDVDMKYGEFISGIYEKDAIEFHAKNAELKDWLKGHPLFKVIDADKENNVAMISRLIMERDLYGDFNLLHDYYMVGISDEYHLYMHSCNGYIPPEASDINLNRKPGILDVYRWMNRDDDRFSHSNRMQGDILCKIVPIEDRWINPDNNSDGQNITGRGFSILKRDTFRYAIIQEGNAVPILREYDVTDHISESTAVKRDITQSRTHWIENGHEIKHDGAIFSIQVRDPEVFWPQTNGLTNYYLVVGAKSVVLEHREHKMVTMHVPDDHIVHLVRQRGEHLHANAINLQALRRDRQEAIRRMEQRTQSARPFD